MAEQKEKRDELFRLIDPQSRSRCPSVHPADCQRLFAFNQDFAPAVGSSSDGTTVGGRSQTARWPLHFFRAASLRRTQLSTKDNTRKQQTRIAKRRRSREGRGRHP
ncbi:hypothetical protein ACFFP0_08930 [Rhizobium puerariae]|uniref:Uncharacterized protein n=1 Tax=Rhizobium puerariae TaxID=1585791 RepID=A0ABV6AFU6_9HYPH